MSSPLDETTVDGRHHVQSMLMRESLLDKRVMSSTETPVVRMLPFCSVVKVGGRSIVDRGKSATYPLVDAIAAALAKFKLVIATGGGIRSRHVTSIGVDLGLPTGVLAQLRIIDALGNAHLLGTLLAPHGVVAIGYSKFSRYPFAPCTPRVRTRSPFTAPISASSQWRMAAR